jgi:hypothetical protein
MFRILDTILATSVVATNDAHGVTGALSLKRRTQGCVCGCVCTHMEYIWAMGQMWGDNKYM